MTKTVSRHVREILQPIVQKIDRMKETWVIPNDNPQKLMGYLATIRSSEKREWMGKVKFRKVFHPKIGVEVSYLMQMAIPSEVFKLEGLPTRFDIASIMMSKEHPAIEFNSSHLLAEDMDKIRILADKLDYQVDHNNFTYTLTLT